MPDQVVGGHNSFLAHNVEMFGIAEQQNCFQTTNSNRSPAVNHCFIDPGIEAVQNRKKGIQYVQTC